LLLLDELSLGLAPVIVERLLPVVREYATESGCGVLLVEQHVQLALTVADRGYVLSHGELVLHDRAEALRGNRDLLMASYFGERATASLDASANPAPGAGGGQADA
jgi:branched-chain amino acid transport system ATP-binding protein